MTQPVYVIIPQAEYEAITDLLTQGLEEARAAREEAAKDRQLLLDKVQRLQRHVVSLWIAVVLLASAGLAGWLLGLARDY